MEPNRTESNSQYQPRKGTLLAALQNAPGASILVGGRMRPVAEVLAEREAEARKANAERRAFEAARTRTAEPARDAEAAQEAYRARQADQAIVDAAHLAAAAKYDHDTIVVKIRHDKQIGSRERVMRVYWRRGDQNEFRLAPQSAQNLIVGCTSERAAAETVARKVTSNGFQVRAFYHENGLRELSLEGPAPSGPQNAQTAEAAPDTVTMHGHTYRLGEPACPTEALFRVEYYAGGIPQSERRPRVFHVKRLTLVAKGNQRPDDAHIAHCGRPIRHADFRLESER